MWLRYWGGPGYKTIQVSRHLNRLKIAGIIHSDKKSQWVYYQLNDNIFQRFPFLSIIINDEIDKISVCKEDLELLKKILASGRYCDWLKIELGLSKRIAVFVLEKSIVSTLSFLNRYLTLDVYKRQVCNSTFIIYLIQIPKTMTTIFWNERLLFH